MLNVKLQVGQKLLAFFCITILQVYNRRNDRPKECSLGPNAGTGWIRQ